MNEFRRYVVMVDYGAYEGMKVHGQTHDRDKAGRLYLDALSNGNSRVYVFEYCPMHATQSYVKWPNTDDEDAPK